MSTRNITPPPVESKTKRGIKYLIFFIALFTPFYFLVSFFTPSPEPPKTENMSGFKVDEPKSRRSFKQGRDYREERKHSGENHFSRTSTRDLVDTESIAQERRTDEIVDGQELLAEARRFVDKSEPEKAKQLLEKILKNDPKNDEALVELGLIYLLDFRDTSEAKAIFQRAAIANPENEVAISELLNIYYEQETVDEGVGFLSDILDKHPENTQLALSIGQLYMDSGRYEDSLPLLKNAAEVGKNKDMALMELARAYGQLGRQEDEVATLDKAINYQEGEIQRIRDDLDSKQQQGGDGEIEETRISLSVAQDSLRYMQIDKAHAMIEGGHYEAAEALIQEMKMNSPGDDSVDQLMRHLNRLKHGNEYPLSEDPSGPH